MSVYNAEDIDWEGILKNPKRPKELVSELIKKTGRSRGTCYRYIKQAVENGIIETGLIEGIGYAYRPRTDRTGLTIHGHFRAYRSLFETFFSMKVESEEKLRDYVSGLCDCYCGRELGAPPSLPSLCLPCTGSLYSQVKEKLISEMGAYPELINSIPIYLAYEYKIELILITYRSMRDALLTLDPAEWWVLFENYQKRLLEMKRREPSLEPRLIKQFWFDPLLSTDTVEEAEKAIRTCMDAARWRVIAVGSENPKAQKVLENTTHRLEEGFYRVINKARCRKSKYGRMLRQSRNPVYAKKIRQLLREQAIETSSQSVEEEDFL